MDGGYGINESIEFSREYQKAGVDMFHVSAGGEGQIAAEGRPGTHVAYQVPLARAIKQALHIPVIAVGRGMLRNPYWTLEAAATLHKEIEIPVQYSLGFPKSKKQVVRLRGKARNSE